MQKIITWRGHRFNQRTIDMLTEAERLFGKPLVFMQGSYNKGVSDSAGTHDAGGAVDIRVRDFDASERVHLVACLRMVGFAAWLRTTAQGFDAPHVHAEAVKDPDLSPEAAAQVAQYLAGKNGLASKGKDDGPRTWVGMTWERYEQENGMSATDADRVIKQVNAVSAHLALNAAQNRRGLFQDLAKLIESLKDGQTEQLTTYMRQMDAANDAEVAKLQAAVDALPKGDDGDGQAS